MRSMLVPLHGLRGLRGLVTRSRTAESGNGPSANGGAVAAQTTTASRRTTASGSSASTSNANLLAPPPFEQFRTVPRVHWYPGHMEKALRQMRERLRGDRVGVVVEVRDARVPLSCLNWKFEVLGAGGGGHDASVDAHGDIRDNGEGNYGTAAATTAAIPPTLKKVHRDGRVTTVRAATTVFRNAWGEVIGAPVHRPHSIVVYNKTDLVDGPAFRDDSSGRRKVVDDRVANRDGRTPEDEAAALHWRDVLRQCHARYCDRRQLIFTTIKKHTANGVDEILVSAVRHWVQLHRASMQATPNRPYPPLHILVTGLPNTGKSTLINALRVYGMGYGSARGSKRVATVGKEPGQTLALSGMIKVVDTETVALQHVYGSTRLLDTRQSQLAAETPVARLLRSMNVRLKVFVMDTPGLLPPNIPNPHVGVKLALAGCVPDDSSGMRGADSYLLCEYLWWRMRERWHIAEQVLRAIDYRHGREATARSTVAATGDDTLPSVDDLLRHFARQHYAKKGRRLPEASGKQLSAMDMDVATGAFLKLWRTGDLYRKMQLLPSSSTTATGRQAAIAKDLWRVTMLDDDFAAGQEHVEAWFKRKYHGASDGEEAVATGAAQTTMRTTHNHLIYRPEIPTMATTTKLGAMNVTDDEMLNARERQKRRRQSVKRRR